MPSLITLLALSPLQAGRRDCGAAHIAGLQRQLHQRRGHQAGGRQAGAGGKGGLQGGSGRCEVAKGWSWGGRRERRCAERLQKVASDLGRVVGTCAFNISLLVLSRCVDSNKYLLAGLYACGVVPWKIMLVMPVYGSGGGAGTAQVSVVEGPQQRGGGGGSGRTMQITVRALAGAVKGKLNECVCVCVVVRACRRCGWHQSINP